jgi:hypothetical protein
MIILRVAGLQHSPISLLSGAGLWVSALCIVNRFLWFPMRLNDIRIHVSSVKPKFHRLTSFAHKGVQRLIRVTS